MCRAKRCATLCVRVVRFEGHDRDLLPTAAPAASAGLELVLRGLELVADGDLGRGLDVIVEQHREAHLPHWSQSSSDYTPRMLRAARRQSSVTIRSKLG